MPNSVRFFVFLISFCLLFFGCAKNTSHHLEPSLEAVTSKQLKEVIASHRGKVVLVNFWATWCEPCQEELPFLLDFARDQASRGYVFLLVSMDFPEERPNLLNALRRFDVEFTTFLNVERDSEFIPAMHKEWTGVLPATLVFDRSGTLRYFWQKEISSSDLNELVIPIINEKRSTL